MSHVVILFVKSLICSILKKENHHSAHKFVTVTNVKHLIPLKFQRTIFFSNIVLKFAIVCFKWFCKGNIFPHVDYVKPFCIYSRSAAV